MSFPFATYKTARRPTDVYWTPHAQLYTEGEEIPNLLGAGIDYVYRTKLEVSVQFSVAQTAEPGAFTHARENAEAAITDYVYGEVRRLAILAEREILYGDRNNALAAVKAIQKETEYL